MKDENYGERIRTYRERNGLTLDMLSEQCGLSRATLCKLERGKPCYIQAVTKYKLDKVLNEKGDE